MAAQESQQLIEPLSPIHLEWPVPTYRLCIEWRLEGAPRLFFAGVAPSNKVAGDGIGNGPAPLEVGVMPKAEDYRKEAEECLRLARNVKSPDQCEKLLKIAEMWIALAHQREQHLDTADG